VYRLALLLTGTAKRASRVTEAVIGVRSDPSRMRGTLLDRLTVLRSREVSRAPLDAPEIDATTRTMLFELSRQQLEAWVFHRVFGLPLRDMAKGMDCSVTATARHLDEAESALEREGGAGASARAAASVRAWIAMVDVPVFHRRRMERRRRIRLGVRIVGILLILIALVVIIVQFV